jgi:transcriptional regulator with XRE-family HTH domain
MECSLKEQIIELRVESGFTYSQITKQLNCAKSLVSYYCRGENLENHNTLTKVSDDEIEVIKRIYNETKSLNKTAKKTGWSKATVFKYVETIKREKLSEDEIKENRIKAVVSFRQRLKVDLVAYKGGGCEICGYNKSLKALHFHHLDPKTKKFGISSANKSFLEIKAEVDKCVLLCSNCHSEVHEGLITLK